MLGGISPRLVEVEMKIRNRNAISDIRKKFERLEEYKKLDRKGERFTKLDEAKNILRELQMETLSIERELTDLFDMNSGVNIVERNQQRALAKLAADPNFTKNVGGFTYLFKAITLRKNGKDILIGDILYEYRGYHHFYNENYRLKNTLRCAHPHIYNGSPCFGQYDRIVHRMEQAGDYDEMVNTIKDFLFSYNPDSVFLSLDRWDSEFTYLSCGCLEGECECYNDDYEDEEEEEEDEEELGATTPPEDF